MKRLIWITLSLYVIFFGKLIAGETSLKENIIRIPLLTAHLAQEKILARIEAKEINFLPQQKTGVHLHPCPVVGYIAAGNIYFQLEGKSAKILHAGDAFFEPANVKILRFDNISKNKNVRFIAFYLLGKSDKEFIVPLNER